MIWAFLVFYAIYIIYFLLTKNNNNILPWKRVKIQSYYMESMESILYIHKQLGKYVYSFFILV